MVRRALLPAAVSLLLAAAPAPPPFGPSQAGPAPPPSPAWVQEVAGHYTGTVRNAGHMECHRTELSVEDGQLVGRYSIDGADPFEGTLTGFVAESDTSGHFTWTDRYGSGVEFLVFSSDRRSFAGAWGTDRVDPAEPVWGQRGGGTCGAPAVSRRGGGHPDPTPVRDGAGTPG